MKPLINKRTLLLIVTLLLIQWLALPAVARTEDALASKSGDHPRTRLAAYSIAAQRNIPAFDDSRVDVLNTGLLSSFPKESRSFDLTYWFPSGNRISVGYKRLNQGSFDPLADFAVKEKAVMVDWDYFLTDDSLPASSGIDEFNDKVLDISFFWRPSGWRRSAEDFEASQQSFIEARQPMKLGLNASCSLTDKLFFGSTLQKIGSDRDRWIGTLNYTLPNDHLISLLGRYSDHEESDPENTTSVMFIYTIPLGSPVSRK